MFLAPFCEIRLINDTKYSEKEVWIWKAEEEAASTEPYQQNMYNCGIHAQDRNMSGIRWYATVEVRALRNILGRAELFVNNHNGYKYFQ